jgi:hypothetical protein
MVAAFRSLLHLHRLLLLLHLLIPLASSASPQPTPEPTMPQSTQRTFQSEYQRVRFDINAAAKLNTKVYNATNLMYRHYITNVSTVKNFAALTAAVNAIGRQSQALVNYQRHAVDAVQLVWSQGQHGSRKLGSALSGAGCRVDADCVQGLYCNFIPGTTNSFVTVAAHYACGSPVPCLSDSECKFGKRCNSHVCSDPVFCGTTDSVCPAAKLCYTQYCGDPQSCSTSSTCPLGTTCNNLVCRSRGPKGTTCSASDNCLDGLTCTNGVCSDPPCKQDADCDALRRCYNQACSTPIYCTTTGTCPSGKVCSKNICGDKSVCKADSDCTFKQRCYNNACSIPVSCGSDNDCASQTCNAGVCGGTNPRVAPSYFLRPPFSHIFCARTPTFPF